MKFSQERVFKDLKLVRSAGRAFRLAKAVGAASVIIAAVRIGWDIFAAVRQTAH